MRITRIDSSYLQKRYGDGLSSSGEPYAKQYDELVEDCFGWADFWARALKKRGYEYWDSFANVRRMQVRWAIENDVSYSETGWEEEILAAQVKWFRPEILFVEDHHSFSGAFIQELRRACPSIRFVIVWCGSPFRDAAVFGACDIALSNIPELVRDIKAAGAEARYLPHGFDPVVLERLGKSGPKLYDLTFVGLIVAHAGYHNRRAELIKELLVRSNLVLFSGVWLPTGYQRAKHAVKGAALRLFGKPQQSYFGYEIGERAKKNIRPPVYGREMFRVLQQSKSVLNNHIDVSAGSASNMRLFEVTGVGSCLLTDWKDNIRELFEPDKEVVTYRSVEECVEKARWLAENDAAREAIAKAGQARTLRDHSFDNRAAVLDGIIRDSLKKG